MTASAAPLHLVTLHLAFRSARLRVGQGPQRSGIVTSNKICLPAVCASYAYLNYLTTPTRESSACEKDEYEVWCCHVVITASRVGVVNALDKSVARGTLVIPRRTSGNEGSVTRKRAITEDDSIRDPAWRRHCPFHRRQIRVLPLLFKLAIPKHGSCEGPPASVTPPAGIVTCNIVTCDRQYTQIFIGPIKSGVIVCQMPLVI
ncbi:hypothetical protein BC827DRAFT_1154057 [Russula dissimulans]|nr:hypothetical protein BC827DRAFT_1154057 [Russula dissimulans]